MPSPTQALRSEAARALRFLGPESDCLVAVARPDPGSGAAERLAAVLRNRGWDATQRRWAAVVSLDLAQWWGRAAYRAGGDADAGRLLATFLIDVAGWPASPVEEAFAAVGRVTRDWPSDPVARGAVETACPEWLFRRWVARFGLGDARRLSEAMNEPAPVVLRANAARVDRETLVARLRGEGVEAAPVGGPHALVVVGRANLWATQAWRDGLFEVQDTASQRVVDGLGLPEGSTVVDLCAGAGGKTVALAAAVGPSGRVIAIEPDAARVADLRGRLRRTGHANVEVRPGSALEVTADLRAKADSVVVDAPCSSLGVLRRSPGRKWTVDPAEPARWTALQSALLAAGAACVRPGGRLVFATCSTEPEEGEDVAHAFDAGPGFHAVERVRTFPHIDGGDGFFIASWRARIA